MFERPHHRRIAAVLQALDGHRLLAHRCLFGGGTAIALRHGEYRESVDIDFMVSDLAGYRALRQALGGRQDLQPIVREGLALECLREVRADQYGIRTLVASQGVPLKLEIVLEGRITLDPPGDSDLVCGVATLTPLDMAASKLLANADRWRDEAVFGRDLIDLAMMSTSRELLGRALDKARVPYGASVDRALDDAVRRLRDDPHRLDHCMRAMAMDRVPKAVLWGRIKALARAAGLASARPAKGRRPDGRG